MGARAGKRVLQALAKLSRAYVHLAAFSGAVTAKQRFSSFSLPPVHTNQPFSAPLGCEGHTSPSQSFHHPHSQPLVFLYAVCALHPLPRAPDLLSPAGNKSLVTGASSHTMDPSATIRGATNVFLCHPCCHSHLLFALLYAQSCIPSSAASALPAT